MPKASPAAQALIAYAQGVNDDIAQVRASGQWPAVFSLAGVYPAPWTPVDSLVIQGELTQELDFTTTPLDYALLERSLGAARTMAWFPVIAKNAQTPYDPGPYRQAPADPARRPRRPRLCGTRTAQPRRSHQARSGPTAAEAQAAAGALLSSAQPAARRASCTNIPDSNAWAAERARGRRGRRAAGRRPAPAADAAVGLVRGRPVRAGLRRRRGQRARPARDPASGTTPTSPGR